MDITLRLLDDDSLPVLLAGQRTFRVWLSENEDGTYGLHALVADDPTTEAWMRVIAPVEDESALPEPEPSAEVAEHMERIRGWLDGLQ